MKNKIDMHVIDGLSSVGDALAKIDANQNGAVFLASPHLSIYGIATDGDIRRWLIAGGNIDDPIECCANRDFVWEHQGAQRENIIKKFDQHIKLVPILDDAKRLVDLITRENIISSLEKPTFARSRAPVRISFGGGGSDLTYYFSNGKGAILNTTISLYCHATLCPRIDNKVSVNSLDLSNTVCCESLEEFLVGNHQFGLIAAILQVIKPKHGFDLFLRSEVPIGSGLGGSAAISAAITGCFNEFRKDKWNRHELSEITYLAERHYLGVEGGWQDQYATVFGGFNFMEFQKSQNLIQPLRIQDNILMELEECLVLCDTGLTHSSGKIHSTQRQNSLKPQIQKIIKKNVELCYQIRDSLLRGELAEVGIALDATWQLKRSLSDEISSPYLDQIYEGARQNGATGGKLLGAGAGGFFLFFVPYSRRNALVQYLKHINLCVREFRFDSAGVSTWSVRESQYTDNNKVQKS